MRVYLIALSGDQIVVDVGPEVTIKWLKHLLFIRSGDFPEQLTLAGAILLDDMTIQDYGIKDWDRIYHVTNRSLEQEMDPYKITVQNAQGKKYLFTVLPTVIVRSIKKRIEDETGIAIKKQRLICPDYVMENHQTIGECKIRENTLIYLIVV